MKHEYGKVYLMGKLTLLLVNVTKHKLEYHIFSPRGKLIGNCSKNKIGKSKLIYIHIEDKYIDKVDSKKIMELLK